MLKELSVSKIVKQLRVLKAAAKETISPKHWKHLKKQHELMAYSELESSGECSTPKDDNFDLSHHLSASHTKDFNSLDHINKSITDKRTLQRQTYTRTKTLNPVHVK